VSKFSDDAVECLSETPSCKLNFDQQVCSAPDLGARYKLKNGGNVYLFVISRHIQNFVSHMMVVSFYWWKRVPRYIIQCVWGETTNQVN
jgi:hypothetical protein